MMFVAVAMMFVAVTMILVASWRWAWCCATAVGAVGQPVGGRRRPVRKLGRWRWRWRWRSVELGDGVGVGGGGGDGGGVAGVADEAWPAIIVLAALPKIGAPLASSRRFDGTRDHV